SKRDWSSDVCSSDLLAKDNRTVHLDGKLGTASSAAEIMLLEYGQWDHPAGWGAVDKGALQRLLPVHSTVFDAVNRAPSVAAGRELGRASCRGRAAQG